MSLEKIIQFGKKQFFLISTALSLAGCGIPPTSILSPPADAQVKMYIDSFVADAEPTGSDGGDTTPDALSPDGSIQYPDTFYQSDGSNDAQAQPDALLPNAKNDGSPDVATPDANFVADADISQDAQVQCIPRQYFQDSDGDGSGDTNNNQIFCEGQQQNTYTLISGDCNDTNAFVWQEALAYPDNDGDGFGAGNLVTICQGNSLPEGYALNDLDCNDTDSSVWQEFMAYADNDGDGFGSTELVYVCDDSSTPWSLNNLDCADDNNLINPLALELCDGLNNDCDEFIDDDLTVLSQGCTVGTGACQGSGLEYKICQGEQGWSEEYFNCDAIEGGPGEAQCNGVDNDCDGVIDCNDLEGEILFVSNRNNNEDIYLINANGTDLIQLTTDSAIDRSPSWSPIVNLTPYTFAYESTSQSNELEIINFEPFTNLTNEPTLDDRFPSWSPDGLKLCFHRGPRGDIYLINSDGTNLEEVLLNAPYKQSCAWSPDGSRIAYVWEWYEGNYEISILPFGAGDTNITTQSPYDNAPIWSPDGLFIVFETNRDGNFEIYRMNPDGTNAINLTNHPANDRNPDYSSNGLRIVFDSDRDGDREIYNMNYDGTNQRRITFDPGDDYDPNIN